MNVQKINQLGKRLYFLVRNDPEAQLQIRLTGLGLLVCFAIFYCGTVLFIEPQEKLLNNKISQQQKLTSSFSGQHRQMLVQQEDKLHKEKDNLEQQVSLLPLKENFLREHYESWSDIDRFTKIILTLVPFAPVNMEKNIKQMSQLDVRNLENYSLHSLKISGNADFKSLFTYLQYLENQPEVSVIENLNIERIPEEHYDQQSTVSFEVVVGRLSMEVAP